jgi:GTPase SAR1 family protein
MAVSKKLQQIRDKLQIQSPGPEQPEKISQLIKKETAKKKRLQGKTDFERDFKTNITLEQCRYIQHLGYVFRRNVTKSVIEVSRDDAKTWQHLDDSHVDDIWIDFEISDEFKKQDKCGQLRIYSLINTRLLSEEYLPVLHYFKGLQWDGRDHIAQLAGTVKIQDDPKNQIKGSQYWLPLLRTYLIASVQCSLGLKENQVMLVMVGAQGRGKTTWLNRLCPPPLNPEYLHTGHIDPTLLNNDTCNVLAEKVIANIDDQLEQIFGKDFNALKALITTSQVGNRKSYERRAKVRARICNFVASVNTWHLFHDIENRRYLTFAISEINSYHKVNMNQVWAQAYEAFKKGETAYFDSVAVQVINTLNQSFSVPLEEQEWFMRMYDVLDERKDLGGVYMQISEMLAYMQKASGLRLRLWRLSNIVFRRLGLESISKRTSAGPRYVYYIRQKYAVIDGRVVLMEEKPEDITATM